MKIDYVLCYYVNIVTIARHSHVYFTLEGTSKRLWEIVRWSATVGNREVVGNWNGIVMSK